MGGTIWSQIKGERHDHIRENYRDLSVVLALAVVPISAFLFQKKIIGSAKKSEIEHPSLTAFQQANKILDVVGSSGPEAYEALYEAVLHECMWKAADMLRPENSPHFPKERASSGSDSDIFDLKEDSFSSNTSSELCLLICGTPDSGKTSTANTILGKLIFGPDKRYRHGSEGLDFHMAMEVIDGREITVVLKPSMYHCHNPIELIKTSLRIHPGGFNAILVVMSLMNPRFTEESLEYIITVIGERVLQDHVVIIFSYGDSFEKLTEGRSTFDEWCRQQTGPLKQLLIKCKYRCILFDNTKTEKNILRRQRNQLFKMIDKMMSNGRILTAHICQEKYGYKMDEYDD